MEEPVLADGLSERLGLLEDGSPCLNFGNVGIHTLTALDGVRKRPDDLTEVLSSLNWVQSLDVREGHFGLLDEDITSSHAGLELIKMVVASEAVDEASNEVRDGVEGKRKGRETSLDSDVREHTFSLIRNKLL